MTGSVESDCIGVAEAWLERGAWRARTISQSAEGRAVVLLDRGREAIVAKCFDSAKEAAACRLALDRLGGMRNPFLRVPRILGFDAERRVVLMTSVAGRPVAELRGRSLIDALDRAGRGLRALHALPIGVEKRMTFSMHREATLRPPLECLVECCADAAPLVEGLDAFAPALERARFANVLIHRDFQLRQLFDDGESVGVVDWDDLAAGDPAYDVAYMLAYLDNHLDRTCSPEARRAFLGGYGDVAGLEERLPAYELFNHLRRCCRRLRLRDEGWREAVAKTLARAAETLAYLQAER